jgi:uncharacterized MAPEG superfamily protein
MSKLSLPTNISLSILSIPVYYVISVLPHSYAISLATSGKPLKWDNRNPRGIGHRAHLKSTLPPEKFARYERAEAASANALENFPVYTAAMILGHVAGVDKDALDRFAAAWLVLRVAHSLVYVNRSRHGWTAVRTGLYVASIATCFNIFVQAAKKLA